MMPLNSLLKWYDDNARELPWRGARPDAYHVLLSEIMLQQTTVMTVKAYFQAFTQKWPTLKALAQAEDEEVMRAWAGLGYYARARNLIKAVRQINAVGDFPTSSSELIKFAGIGPYTSAAIAAIAFNESILPRDGNINRILARYFGIDDPINRPSTRLESVAQQWAHQKRPGDVAQALMDLGSGICRPKNPKCEICPLSIGCQAYHEARIEELPVKVKAKPKRIAYAHCYILESDSGAIGFVRRDKNAILGDMLALPTSEWKERWPSFVPPCQGDWRELGEVRHIFTHIDLTMKVWQARGHAEFIFLNSNEISANELPRLWSKALEKMHFSTHSCLHDQ